MNDYVATEFAYKNGYNQALKDFVERMKMLNNTNLIMWNEQIDQIAKELERK